MAVASLCATWHTWTVLFSNVSFLAEERARTESIRSVITHIPIGYKTNTLNKQYRWRRLLVKPENIYYYTYIYIYRLEWKRYPRDFFRFKIRRRRLRYVRACIIMFVQETKSVAGGRRGFRNEHVTFTLIGAVSDLEDLNGDGTLSNYILCARQTGERRGGPASRRKPRRRDDNSTVTVNILLGRRRRRDVGTGRASVVNAIVCAYTCKHLR